MVIPDWGITRVRLKVAPEMFCAGTMVTVRESEMPAAEKAAAPSTVTPVNAPFITWVPKGKATSMELTPPSRAPSTLV